MASPNRYVADRLLSENQQMQQGEARLLKSKCWLALLAIPPALVALYFSLSEFNVTNDAASFLQDAQRLLEVLRKGANGGRVFALLHKPTLLPFTLAGALLATGRHLKTGLALHGVAMMGILVAYLYLHLKLTTSRASAALGAVAIATLPWVMGLIVMSEAESLYVPAAVAAFYHLRRSGAFTRVRASWCFFAWTSVAIMTRPVEAAIYLLPLVPVMALLGAKSGRARALWLVPALAAFALGVGGWMWGAWSRLEGWVRVTVDQAIVVGPLGRSGSEIAAKVAFVIFGVPALLLLIARALDWRTRSGSRRDWFSAESLCWAHVVLLVPVLITIVRLMSPHYYYFSFIAAFMLLARPTGRRPGLSTGLLALAAAFNVLLTISFFRFVPAAPRISNWIWPSNPQYRWIRRTESPASQVARQLRELAPRLRPNNERLLVATILYYREGGLRDSFSFAKGIGIFLEPARDGIFVTDAALKGFESFFPTLSAAAFRELEACATHFLIGPLEAAGGDLRAYESRGRARVATIMTQGPGWDGDRKTDTYALIRLRPSLSSECATKLLPWIYR